MTAINRILIVDDEDNVRRMLSTAFALQGFETHCANNGRTALMNPLMIFIKIIKLR
ncbi:Transcriptional regulatory protein SrrA [Escherichia coli]|nr:Transcriptional regulatory protein SrrA [Escherichia coli]